MDTSNIPAAGSKPNKQTFDQAPVSRQVQTIPQYQEYKINLIFLESILLLLFNNHQDKVFVQKQIYLVQKPKQQSNKKLDKIKHFNLKFSHQNQFKMFLHLLKIFKLLKHHKKKLKDIRKRTMIQQQQGIYYFINFLLLFLLYHINKYNKQFIMINYNRQVDHGKEFLFGKSDFDEYKSLKRAVTLNEFKPKLDYDPNNRRNKELYGNEIAREHLPTKEVNLEVSSPQKPKKLQQQQQDQNPSNRKLMENQSNVFGDSPTKPIKGQKVEKLTASTQKWSTVGGQSNNQVKEFDPDTYAKNRKEAELQSSVFGEQPVKVQPVSISESKEESETQQSQSQQEQSQKQQKPKERLIPNNQTWQQTDSVKNKRDFDPTQSQVQDEIDPSQKKMDILKSSMDTHQFESQQIPANQKITNKSLKQKKDIIQREEKLNKEKSTKTQSKKK